MHPLNSRSFGNATGTIKVHYHNGSSVVTGYIVKQPSATKWVVTSNGVTTYTCSLAADGTPAAGEFTINAQAVVHGAIVSNTTVEHVTRIDGHHVSTAEGHRYAWTTAASLPTSNAGVHQFAKLETN